MTPEQLEARIRDWTDRWQTRMGLHHYSVRTQFVNLYSPEDDAGQAKILADTDAAWEYLQATITWYTPACLRWDEETIERSVVHELCHVLLNSEQSAVTKASDHERVELATEMTTNALWSAWEEDQ